VATALRPVVASPPLSSRRHGIGFWLAGYVFAITMAFSAVPAPLYVLYQARDHFGALAGAGAGAVFKGGISTVLDIAPDETRGEALAGLFLAAYLGLAVPVIGLGFATQAFSVRTALLGFSVLLAVVIALVARRLVSDRR
jgi:MFS family permease